MLNCKCVEGRGRQIYSYNGCRQHGPDEHLLMAPARQGIAAFAGLWWDLGEPGTPAMAADAAEF